MAENIIKALEKLTVNIPIIVRLEGNNSENGLKYIKEKSKNKIYIRTKINKENFIKIYIK